MWNEIIVLCRLARVQERAHVQGYCQIFRHLGHIYHIRENSFVAGLEESELWAPEHFLDDVDRRLEEFCV